MRSVSLRSLLLMQGKSSDFAKHAIPSIRKQRILVTLTQYQPKKSTLSDGPRHHSSYGPSPHWCPSPGRSPSHLRHRGGLKHYPTAPTTGVLPPPAIPSLIPPNGIQPHFFTTQVVHPMTFPCPVSVPPGSWPPAPPRPPPPPPRVLFSGTGVFLRPPGSGNPSSQQSPSMTAGVNSKVETGSILENNDAYRKSNHISSTSPEGNSECNASIDGADSLQTAKCEEGSVDKTKANSYISSD